MDQQAYIFYMLLRNDTIRSEVKIRRGKMHLITCVDVSHVSHPPRFAHFMKNATMTAFRNPTFAPIHAVPSAALRYMM